jgi:hypothetical protein
MAISRRNFLATLSAINILNVQGLAQARKPDKWMIRGPGGGGIRRFNDSEMTLRARQMLAQTEETTARSVFCRYELEAINSSRPEEINRLLPVFARTHQPLFSKVTTALAADRGIWLSRAAQHELTDIAFATTLAHELKPYGMWVHGRRTLTTLLASPTLECRSYCYLATNFLRVIAPQNTMRIWFLSWHKSGVGSHNQLFVETSDRSCAILLDPTIGLLSIVNSLYSIEKNTIIGGVDTFSELAERSANTGCMYAPSKRETLDRQDIPLAPSGLRACLDADCILDLSPETHGRNNTTTGIAGMQNHCLYLFAASNRPRWMPELAMVERFEGGIAEIDGSFEEVSGRFATLSVETRQGDVRSFGFRPVGSP